MQFSADGFRHITRQETGNDTTKEARPVLTANIPPINPGVRPGRSAMENAIKPANTGTIKANAESPPICINAAANVPFSLNASIPKTKDRAIHSPRQPPLAACKTHPSIDGDKGHRSQFSYSPYCYWFSADKRQPRPVLYQFLRRFLQCQTGCGAVHRFAGKFVQIHFDVSSHNH